MPMGVVHDPGLAIFFFLLQICFWERSLMLPNSEASEKKVMHPSIVARVLIQNTGVVGNRPFFRALDS